MSLNDPHVKETYKFCKEYFNEKKEKYNNDILEFVCKYHHCVNHPFKSDITLFNELNRMYEERTVYIIMHLIKQFKLGKDGKTYPEYQIYLDALNASHTD